MKSDVFIITIVITLAIGPLPVIAGAVAPAARGISGLEIVPDHDVQYAGKVSLPSWKKEWDQARSLYREGKIGQALVQYELLLQKKKNIDEARWEFASLLIQEHRWSRAGKELDILVAHEPGNHKYLLARANVALAEGHADEAVTLYGQIYQESPEGPDGVVALTGLVEALHRQGNSNAELPLLETLLLRKPEESALIMRGAALALELDQPQKALDMLKKAIRKRPGDLEVLRQLAQTEERLGLEEQAAVSWQKLVGKNGLDEQANTWLSQYYEKRGNLSMALVHVERLLKHDPVNADLMLRAARLERRLGRPGQALDYYLLYLDLRPEDTLVRIERRQIRKGLAMDLIALVDAPGQSNFERLWQDLARITRDRSGVFASMATWFRLHKNPEAAVEIEKILRRSSALAVVPSTRIAGNRAD